MAKNISYCTESVSSMSSDGLADSLDHIQVKKKALLFLCRINADYREVERFLRTHPEALLFEGAESDGGSQILVEHQMKRCRCFVSVCNSNRRKLLAILQRGFEFYREMALSNSTESVFFPKQISGWVHREYFFCQLKSLERDLRGVNERRTRVESKITRAREELREYRFDLENISRKEKTSRSSLAVLRCQQRTETVSRRLFLENLFGSTSLQIKSLENEYELLNQERLVSRQLQKALLKTAFAGCKRHVCDTTRKDGD